MVIAVVGAGLSGLVAAKMLADGGHEVKVYERARSAGGRLASMRGGTSGEIVIDYRESCFPYSGDLFGNVVSELETNNILTPWTDHFPYFNGEELEERYPGLEDQTYYIAPDGMSRWGHYLSRWVDLKTNERVGGFTYIGPNRRNKSPWMLNLTSFDVFEVDAIIVATPAPQAYGLINSCQDETLVRGLIPVLEGIRYESCYTLALTFNGGKIPDWKAVQSAHGDIDWIINESSKRATGDEMTVVIHSSDQFYRRNLHKTDEDIRRGLLDAAAQIAGDWITKPDWSNLHTWKYRQVQNPLDQAFVEINREVGTLALIGDYLGGSSIESAYLSGYQLARHWLERYPVKATM